ncbi:MAG: FAD-dependent oxidoreductase [Shimia sp.]|uniref:NAD(P)/FAD-dependent oxidoreductase n=1 Tax=Shimia sp. TaxID=1954381 RepID=UPI003B8D30B3
MTTTQKKIIIVGGGYAGFEIAKGLDGVADVTVVEPREAFVQPPATIRALLEPALLDQTILPYGKLLKNGRVVQDRVAQIAADQVTLESGAVLPADYIVVATGSSYAAPFKPAGDSIEAFKAAHAAASTDIMNAKSIAIVGAGAVGSELAGEIAAAQPDKQVTLISSEERLFPMYPAKLGAQLAQKLERMGVTIVLGQRAETLQRLDAPYAGSVTLSNGQTIAADLVVPVIGSRPNTTLLEALPGAEITQSKRVKTDGWMRPSDLPNVFVAGDIADVGDGMTIVAITRQAPWLIKTLKAVVKGAVVEDQKPYHPWKQAPILVPLGPHIGNSWLFATVGNWVTRMMKGRDLFIPKYRKAFGLSGDAK